VPTFDVLGRTRLDALGVVLDLHGLGIEVVSAGGGHLSGDDRALRWLAAERPRQRRRIKAGLATKRARGASSGRTWARVPAAPGHRFRRHLGTNSGALGQPFRCTWAPIPAHLGKGAARG
jgi:hypothetical protein